MRLSKAIEAVRELLQAPDATHWSDNQIGLHLNRHALSLSRRMAEVDEGYFNATVRLAKTAARQAKADVFDYTLPSWTERIVEVRENASTTDPTGIGRTTVVPLATKYGTGGWLPQLNGLRLVTTRGALDLELAVAKRPAAVTKGTLPTQANLPATPTGAFLRLDADTSTDAQVFPHETLAGSYTNAVVEITGNSARSGQMLAVVGSTHFQNEAGTLYTVLQMESAWTVAPQAGDTYELHFEIPEQHMQLVLYMAANSLWGTRGQYEQQKAFAAVLADEYSSFQRHITPRQVAQPYYMRHTILPAGAQGILRTEDTQYPLWR